jgi:hypothetical protein
MKTEIIEEHKEAPDYPALYKLNEGGLIVLMHEAGCGTILVNELGMDVGVCKLDLWDMEQFEKITTPITIKFGG